jgi:hypothetical protein
VASIDVSFYGGQSVWIFSRHAESVSCGKTNNKKHEFPGDGPQNTVKKKEIKVNFLIFKASSLVANVFWSF